MSTASLAQQIIEWIFAQRHNPGDDQVTFTRDDLIPAADALGAPRPKNLGDIVYSLRYRVPLPDSIRRTAPPDREWAIFPGGNAVYTLRTVPFNLIEPRKGLRTIRLPDATPGVISKYSLTDEQALLARVRYNRLLDVFTGLACYPLQRHLRTSITITKRHRRQAQQLAGRNRRRLRRPGRTRRALHPASTGQGRLGLTQRHPDLAGPTSR